MFFKYRFRQGPGHFIYTHNPVTTEEGRTRCIKNPVGIKRHIHPGCDELTYAGPGRGADTIFHAFQKNGITEYHIYTGIAALTRESASCEVLGRITREELAHYHVDA